MLKRILSFIITGLRPLLGPAHCKYAVGCTQFSLMQLEEQSLPVAFATILRRLISCNPFFNLIKPIFISTVFLMASNISARNIEYISLQFSGCDQEIMLSLPILKKVISTIAEDINNSLSGDARDEYQNDGYILLQLLKNKSFLSLSAFNQEKRIDVGIHTITTHVNKTELAKKIKNILKATSYKITT
jgi:hypothetical protein